VGLARSGVAAARALRRRGLPVIGLDSGDPERSERLRKDAEALRAEDIEVHLGIDGTQLLLQVGSIVKSPGVPEEAPVIAAARRQGITVLGELELAWRMMSNELIVVTGTNGKTTTVELLAHIHREAGLPVALAGNVGLALSALVGRIPVEVPVVCEASSFQLQDTIELAPEAAVLLNLAPDHLDRHGSFAAYADAKLQAFAHQDADGLAVLPEDLQLPEPQPGCELAMQRIRQLGFKGWFVCIGNRKDIYAEDGVIRWRGEPLVRTASLRIKGAHNVENAMAAAAVCLARGMQPDAVRKGLESFPGVKHRLEQVRRSPGVLYVNDSKATNVASTLVALAALGGEAGRHIHLILGGQGKGQDFAPLRESVRERCAAVYLIGEDAPSIAAALADSGVPLHDCGELEAAVRLACSQARRAHAAAGWVAAAKGPTKPAGGQAGAPAAQASEIVLLSPACASFDQFMDFEARGERFREIVAGL
jgi:UDP-N-acetylmuramoylalanine--D-glutamate ligase